MPATHREIINDTVQLIPSTITIPTVKLTDHLTMAVDTLVETLQHYSTSPPPGIKIGDPIIQGVRKIANILKKYVPSFHTRTTNSSSNTSTNQQTAYSTVTNTGRNTMRIAHKR